VTLGATVGALGVVFGDIGTSPLYALQAVFSIDHGAVKTTPADVYGVLSLVFWSITIVVSVKYVLFVLRADNDGEGGVMALAALVRRALANTTASRGAIVMAVGVVFGAALFYGDSVITPAISVLSAVSGVNVAAPALSHAVVPTAAVILAALFSVQRWGTGRIGALFGPVMLAWFLVLALIGLRQVAAHPSILRGLSPTYGVEFFAAHPDTAFIAMGAVVLTITGAEALFADLGHFGRRPIRRAWFAVAFPSLTLNYLAQGSIILRHPAAKANPFFLLVPHWAQIPLVALAAAAERRPGICGGRQLGAVRRSARGDRWVWLRHPARDGLRRRGYRHVPHHHHAAPHPGADAVALEDLAGPGRRDRHRRSRAHVLRCQPDQGHPRWLAALTHRAHRVHDHDDLASTP